MEFLCNYDSDSESEESTNDESTTQPTTQPVEEVNSVESTTQPMEEVNMLEPTTRPMQPMVETPTSPIVVTKKMVTNQLKKLAGFNVAGSKEVESTRPQRQAKSGNKYYVCSSDDESSTDNDCVLVVPPPTKMTPVTTTYKLGDRINMIWYPWSSNSTHDATIIRNEWDMKDVPDGCMSYYAIQFDGHDEGVYEYDLLNPIFAVKVIKSTTTPPSLSHSMDRQLSVPLSVPKSKPSVTFTSPELAVKPRTTTPPSFSYSKDRQLSVPESVPKSKPSVTFTSPESVVKPRMLNQSTATTNTTTTNANNPTGGISLFDIGGALRYRPMVAGTSTSIHPTSPTKTTVKKFIGEKKIGSAKKKSCPKVYDIVHKYTSENKIQVQYTFNITRRDSSCIRCKKAKNGLDLIPKDEIRVGKTDMSNTSYHCFQYMHLGCFPVPDELHNELKPPYSREATWASLSSNPLLFIESLASERYGNQLADYCMEPLNHVGSLKFPSRKAKSSNRPTKTNRSSTASSSKTTPKKRSGTATSSAKRSATAKSIDRPAKKRRTPMSRESQRKYDADVELMNLDEGAYWEQCTLDFNAAKAAAARASTATTGAVARTTTTGALSVTASSAHRTSTSSSSKDTSKKHSATATSSAHYTSTSSSSKKASAKKVSVVESDAKYAQKIYDAQVVEMAGTTGETELMTNRIIVK